MLRPKRVKKTKASFQKIHINIQYNKRKGRKVYSTWGGNVESSLVQRRNGSVQSLCKGHRHKGNNSSLLLFFFFVIFERPNQRRKNERRRKRDKDMILFFTSIKSYFSLFLQRGLECEERKKDQKKKLRREKRVSRQEVPMVGT